MNLLFMCVENSARSQLAEGLARRIFPDADVQSAGFDPGRLNPFAVQVMKEIDLDISKHVSKSTNDLNPKFLANLDFIITLCAEEVCPILLSQTAKKLHLPFPDPASKEQLSDQESLRRFRDARDGIAKKLKEFKEQAGITLPNESSVGIHESMGFKKIGQFEDIGFKLGTWWDTGWWQLKLQKPTDPKSLSKPRVI